MANLPKTELKKIARAAAGRLLGAAKVKDVDVIGSDALDEQPAYLFSFLFDGTLDPQHEALLRIRLRQKLRDELVARGDDGYPLITILGPLDWEKRQVA
jgi:hypothetical protein